MTKPTPSAAATVMPPSVRVAVGVMAVLALLLLANAALLGFGFDVAVDRVVDENDATRDEARRFVFLSLTLALLPGLALALAAVFLPRRHGWARWVGVVAGGLLVVIAVVTAALGAAVTAASLLLLVLSVAAVASLMARTTRDWLPGPAA